MQQLNQLIDETVAIKLEKTGAISRINDIPTKVRQEQELGDYLEYQFLNLRQLIGANRIQILDHLPLVKHFVDSCYSDGPYCKAQGPWLDLYFNNLIRLGYEGFETNYLISQGYFEIYENVNTTNRQKTVYNNNINSYIFAKRDVVNRERDSYVNPEMQPLLRENQYQMQELERENEYEIQRVCRDNQYWYQNELDRV